MVSGPWVPDAGELIWLEFDPQAGHEQSGRRPALVLSAAAYNEKTGLAVVCPVTSHVKGYPFEVAVPASTGITGVVLSDHLKNLDWRARRAKLAAKVPRHVLRDVLDRVGALLGIDS